jgi:hypothetical protein
MAITGFRVKFPCDNASNLFCNRGIGNETVAVLSVEELKEKSGRVGDFEDFAGEFPRGVNILRSEWFNSARMGLLFSEGADKGLNMS